MGGTYEAGKGKFEEEEVGGALIATDFAQGEGAGSITARLSGAGFWVFLFFCYDTPPCVSRFSCSREHLY